MTRVAAELVPVLLERTLTNALAATTAAHALAATAAKHVLAAPTVTHALAVTVNPNDTGFLKFGFVFNVLGAVLVAVLMVVGIAIAARSHRSRTEGLIGVVGTAALGLLFWGLATDNELPQLATALVSHVIQF